MTDISSVNPDASTSTGPLPEGATTGNIIVPPSPAKTPSCVTLRPDPGIDTREIERFLKMVFGGVTGLVEICLFLEGDRAPFPAFFTLGTPTGPLKDDKSGEPGCYTPQSIAKMIAEADKNGVLHPRRKHDTTLHGVDAWYVRTPSTLSMTPEKGRGGAKNIREVIGFILDGDFGEKGHKKNKDGLPNPKNADEVRDIWRAAGYPEPTVTWHTGGGINGLWMFGQTDENGSATPTPVVIPAGSDGEQPYKNIMRASERWQQRVVREARKRGLHHDSVGNLDRLMRLPGSVNRKSDHHLNPPQVHAEYSGCYYTVDEIMALVPEPVTRKDGSAIDPLTGDEVIPALPERRTSKAPHTGQAPSDDYNQYMWQNNRFRHQLTEDGWTHHSWAGLVENLTRPGKDKKDGQSATFGHNEDPDQPKLHVFSDTAPGLLGTPKEAGGTGGAKDMYLSPAIYLAATRYATHDVVNQDTGEITTRSCTLREAMSLCGKYLARNGYGTQEEANGPEEPTENTTSERTAEPMPQQTAEFEADADAETPFVGHTHERVPDGEGGYVERVTDEYRAWLMARYNGKQNQGAEEGTAQNDKPKKAPKDPIPLEAPYPEPYDLSCFGHLGTVSRAVSDNQEVPADMPLMATLGCVSTAIGGRVVINVRPGHTEYATHYGITQALPGRRKGNPQKWAKAPLSAWEKSRIDANRLEVMKDASLRKVAEARIAEAEKALAKVGTNDAQAMAELEDAHLYKEGLGNPKADCQLFTDNTTAEALAMDMHPQGQRIAVISSESIFLSNLGGRYSRGEPNIDLVLKAFSQEADTGRRVGRDVPQLDRPNLTISLAIQDDSISHLGKASLMMDERGLWGRVMWCVPRDLAGIRQYDVPEIPQHITDEYARRIAALLDRVYTRETLMEMRLSDEATELYAAFYSETDPKLFGPLEKVPFYGWHEKAAGLVVRTAALVTLYEHALDDELPAEIPADVFKAVASQLPVMMGHARKASSFMTINEEDPLEPARKVLQWISTRAQSPVIRVRDILRAFGKDPKFPRLSAVVDALDVLEERGWVVYGRSAEGGVDKGIVRAHPSAVPHLADEEAYQEALVTPVDADEAEEKANARETAVQALAQALDPFVKKFCVTGDEKTHKIPKTDLWECWEAFSSQRVDKQHFTQALKKVCPQVADKRVGGKKVPSYVGITIK